MAYFLAKTDPETYSIDDLKRDGTTEWDGVRNPTAVNFIKTMKPGDTVIIYHSQGQAAIVGLAKVDVGAAARQERREELGRRLQVPEARQEAGDAQGDQGVAQVRRLAARAAGTPEHDVGAGCVLDVAGEAGRVLSKRLLYVERSDASTAAAS